MPNSCGQNQATNDKCDSKRDRQRKDDGENYTNKGHCAPNYQPRRHLLYHWRDRLDIHEFAFRLCTIFKPACGKVWHQRTAASERMRPEKSGALSAACARLLMWARRFNSAKETLRSRTPRS